MTQFRPILLLCGLSTLAMASAQFDTIFVGSFEAASNGPFETPFPTGSAVSARTQYLFQAAELSTALQTDGLIQGLVIDVLDDDAPNTTVDLYVRLKHATFTSMGDLDYGILTQVADTFGLHLDSGTLVIPFDQMPFLWNGSSNLIIEFGIHRTGIPGVDPRVPLDTSFTFMPTYYAQDTVFTPLDALTSGTAPFHGAPGSRPVMGFLVAGGPGSVPSNAVASPNVAIYPNPAHDRLRLRLLKTTGVVTARIFTATGALVTEARMLVPDAAGFVDLALPPMPGGFHLLRVSDDRGSILEQRFVVE